MGDVRPGDRGRLLAGAGDRLGDDLDQRDAGAVVVDQRVVGAVDAPGGAADVQRLAGVLLHVRALDLDAERLAVDVDVGPAVERDRLVVLRGLEVLRHVGVEVVLPGEPAPLGDRAVQRQPDPDRGLDGDPRSPPASRPGSPRHTGQTWVLGSAPNPVAQEQNIFEAVLSSTWTSRPIVGSNAASASSKDSRVSGSCRHSLQLGGPVEQRRRPSARSAAPRARRRPGRRGRRRSPGRAPGCRPAGRPRRPGRWAPRCRGRRRGWRGWWPGR